jgi:hypothetical protein
MRLKQITDTERSPESFNVESVPHMSRRKSHADRSNEVYSPFTDHSKTK